MLSQEYNDNLKKSDEREAPKNKEMENINSVLKKFSDLKNNLEDHILLKKEYFPAFCNIVKLLNKLPQYMERGLFDCNIRIINRVPTYGINYGELSINIVFSDYGFNGISIFYQGNEMFNFKTTPEYYDDNEEKIEASYSCKIWNGKDSLEIASK